MKGVITKHLDTWQDPSVSPTLLASDFKEPHILVHPVQNAGNLGAQEGTGIGGEGEAMFTMLAQQVHGVIHPLYSIGLGGGMNGQGVGGNNDPMYTLTTMDDHAVVHEAPEVYPILNAGGMSGGPLSGPGIDQDGAPMYTVISSQIHGVCHESEVLHPEVVGTLMACGAGTGHVASAGNEMDYVIVHGDTPPKYIVRRLMPVETEILQGFPPGHTDVLFKGKPATDNVRYRATGNSMTTFCLRFIGARLKHYAEAAHASKDISALEDAA